MRRYAVLPRWAVEVSGPEWVERRFAQEYGDTGYRTGDTALRVSFRRSRDPSLPYRLEGRHKSMGWHARISNPFDRPLRADITLLGWPRGFTAALVQTFIVEPLLTCVAGDHGVLASAAGIEENGAVLLLVGGSGTGKSSLTARALAGGRQALGDDQVYVEADGLCSPFPRRLRLYDDVARTAPHAYATLPRRVRTALRVRGLVRWASRSYVAPSLAVQLSLVGEAIKQPLQLGRVVLLTRRRGAAATTLAHIGVEQASEVAAQQVALQRRRLRTLSGDWPDALRDAVLRERERFARAFERVPTLELVVSDQSDAATAVAESARALDLP